MDICLADCVAIDLSEFFENYTYMVVILVAECLHPSNQNHVRDFDGISNRSRVYISCCNLVPDIPIILAIPHKGF